MHRLGFRFTVNGPSNRNLVGRPDIVLPRHKCVVFVHGCFWHRHLGCPRATTPTTRNAFWLAKFEANIARDRRQQHALRASGWMVLIVWECETRDPELLARRLVHDLH
ncbi:MAG TPA: DNA mismatch endonuclease Vsr [Opitutaceae bacterium]